MDRDEPESDSAAGHPWIPPVPTEHGARSMLGAAVLTPFAVAIVRAPPDFGSVVAYTAFALLGIVGLAFREAVRRRLMARPQFRRRLTTFVVVEGAGLVLFVGVLVAVKGWMWGLTIVAIPAILADIWLRRRMLRGRLLGTLTGAISLSFVVPLGVLILDIAGPRWAVGLYVLFVAFHLTAIARVLAARRRGDDEYRTTLFTNVVMHGGFLGAATGGWILGSLGPGAPLVFLAAVGRMAYLLGQDEPPALNALGRGERAFSAVFVLGAPWLLPV